MLSYNLRQVRTPDIQGVLVSCSGIVARGEVCVVVASKVHTKLLQFMCLQANLSAEA